MAELRKEGYLSHVIRNFRVGEEGYLNEEQYYSPFLIQFNDRTRWILFTTTSLRTDRVKGQQWDSDRIKNRDEAITKAFLVYPNDLSQKVLDEFVAQREKYRMRSEFSRIDDIISEQMLIAHIKEKDDEILIESAGKKKPTHIGRELDFGGRNFETAVAATLSSQIYLAKLKMGRTSRSDMFRFYCKLVDGLDIPTDEVDSISATSDRDKIGLLPSGGSPKTDVIVTIKRLDGKTEYRTLTCKRSKKTSVSVHQYKADACADVIDPNNEKLRYLLRRFQQEGAIGKLTPDEVTELTRELKPYVLRFSRWVIGGHGGKGNDFQKANYLVTFNSVQKMLSVHSIDKYIELLLASGRGNFGTPFTWTYPSKRRGIDFQLKIPMLFEEGDGW
ncbi:MAG: MspI family type II restriction endonuclease [Victivallales bacterium]|nr:MspI family type II restriction endonuclease [Victivallales bacterium]